MKTLTDLKDTAQIMYLSKKRKATDGAKNNFMVFFFMQLRKLDMTIEEAFSEKRNVKMSEKHILRYLLCEFNSAYYAEIELEKYFHKSELIGYKRCNLLNSQNIVKKAIINPLTDKKIASALRFYKIKC